MQTIIIEAQENLSHSIFDLLKQAVPDNHIISFDLFFSRLVKLASSSSEFTDPSSSEQSCDTVIYVGARDDDGTDLEHPPVFLPNLNSGDNRGHMAKVLRGTSAELKPKSSTLERKRHSKSPAASNSSQNGLRMCSPSGQVAANNQPSRLRPGSVGSTPTHSWKQKQYLLNSGRGGGTGSLPRNPKGKMPLTGRVAGYRQMPQPPPPQNFWANQQGYDPNMAVYGYMDDQKISMIQNWVDCQSNQRHVVHQQQHHKAMMQQKMVEPEPFAWLNQPQESADGDCKVLTQFKTVESDDSAENEDQCHQSGGVIKNGSNHYLAAAEVHHMPQNSLNDTIQAYTPPLSPNIIVPEDMEVVGQILDQNTDDKEEIIINDTIADHDKKEPDRSQYIRTMDELYTHCEQLVETLSQASEELKQKEAESHQSSEENLNVTVSSLDANKLHFANRTSPNTVFSELVNEVKVCEDTSKYDQLAKLHELYQSVSSINDKAKSHLEEAKIRNNTVNEVTRSSCLSLSALMTDLERISIHSDANSLCSEPVKMYDYNDFSQNLQKNANNGDFSPAEVNLDDLFDFCNKNTTVSLGDLDKCTKELTQNGNNRSDSPILEGIDQELAKYAKLKDLEQVYHPSSKSGNTLLRNPDGASNPDLNSNHNKVPLQRRSPGNGSSGSEEFPLEKPSNHLEQPRLLTSDGQSMSSGSSAPPSKSSPSGCSSISSSSNEHVTQNGSSLQPPVSTNSVLHRTLASKRSSRDERTVLGKSQSTDTSSEVDIWKKKQLPVKEKQQPQNAEVTPVTSTKKVPKFSRLFKLSRSPLKVIQESNRRSKSADTRAITSGSKLPKDKKSSQKATVKNSMDKKVSASTNSLKTSKNAKGASSSVNCSPAVMTSKPPPIYKNKISQHQTPPSPYSVPTAPKFPLKSAASTASSGSGYDSGHDSGILVKPKSSRFIKTCTFVKLRKGSNSSATSGGGGNGNGKGGGGANSCNKITKNGLLVAASKRASQRKSSGYESSAGGVDSSERDSIDSLKGLDEAPTPTSTNKPLSLATKKFLEPINVLRYEESYIHKMDERWRSCEVKRLQHQQKELKTDLTEAKNRIQSNNWTFGLHVADSVEKGRVKPTDPSIIEALQKETSILSKRVDAAKSHCHLTTSFDVDKPEVRRIASPLTNKLLDTCCTTDCESPESIVLAGNSNTSQETEIF